MAPHILRRLLGGTTTTCCPPRPWAGGVLLLLADLLARTLVAPAELPVGILTTLLGGPFFLYLLWRGRRVA